MTITDLIKSASFDERRVIETACIAAQSSKAPKPPTDEARAALFWRAYGIAGGKRLPKADPKPRPRPRPRPGDDEIIILRGFDRYAVRRAGGKPTPAELLRATLNDTNGQKLVRHVMTTIDRHLAQGQDMTLGVQYAIEAARWSWQGAGMSGEFKVDNDIASAIARWAAFCWPDRYAHTLEFRGNQPPASTWPWLNPERPYEPLWRGPAGEPVPPIFDVNAAF